MRRDGIDYCRWQADHCRELAQRQINVDVKARLLRVACEYEQLANSANDLAGDLGTPSKKRGGDPTNNPTDDSKRDAAAKKAVSPWVS